MPCFASNQPILLETKPKKGTKVNLLGMAIVANLDFNGPLSAR